jgi:PAS domain S-box-containing protein
MILDDASRPNLFSDDDYLHGRPTKSILCLPLLKQGRLTGLLYLENTLTSHAFSSDRIAVLELLAAQAAISLENTRLYGDLQEREAKVRRLIDANIIGISVWDFEGRIIEANEAFLDIVGYSRDDLVSDRVHWTALTPREWSDAVGRSREELMATGSCKPYEKEYFRKDGTRVPVLIGAATFGERRDQGVAFVLDLTERKQAEENLRESERRYREAQMALAHANRVTTMGQLTASIAHEVNQPIGALVTNAHVGLRMLGAEPPDLNQAREALEDIIKDGRRASHVIQRIRALVRKAPAQADELDINEVIVETVALARSEILRSGVVLETQLGRDLPSVRGDRVQLQQVIMNLVMNAVEAMSCMGEGTPELQIATDKDRDEHVAITVSDSGPMLEPESLNRFFEAFYSTKPTGMGIGLSICRSIIEAHEGRIWATANEPRGATLHITLPAPARI